MSQAIRLGSRQIGFAFLGAVEVNPNLECVEQNIPNQIYGSTCNRSSITYNVTGATTGTTYIWGTPTAPLSGSAQPVPQNNFSQANLTINGNLAAMTPQTGSFSVTGITNGNCSSNPFNVTVYVAPKPYITNKTATVNADFITSGGTFNVVPVYNNATNNVVPSGTTYTWTTSPVSGITGNVDQPIPQTGISQTLITSLTGTPATVIYTVTPSTSFYGTTCVGDPFTVTVTVNPRPLRIYFSYSYGGTQSPTQIITISALSLSDNDGNTVTLPNVVEPPNQPTSVAVVDYYYPSTAFQGNFPLGNIFYANRCIRKTGTGANFTLNGGSVTFTAGDGTGQTITPIPSTFVSPTTQCFSPTFGTINGTPKYTPKYGQEWKVEIRDFN